MKKKNHINGEEILDTIKSIVGETAKKAASKAVDKTGNYVGNKAGDKIIQLLPMPTIPEDKPLTDYEINERVNQLLSDGTLRKMKLM